MAMTTPAAAQIYHPGQVCWPETPCPGAGSVAPKTASALRPKVARAPTKREGTSGERRAAATARAALSAPRLYRYPTMYKAEAPPLLPPGARNFPPYVQQPYVLVSRSE